MTTLYAYKGKDFTENAIYLNANGTPMNVTGLTSQIKIAKYFNSTEDNLTISGAIVSPATSGTFLYTTTKELLSALNYGTHVYSRYLYDSLGKTMSVVNGNFIIIPTV